MAEQCEKCGIEIDPKFFGHVCEALINEEVPDDFRPDEFEMMGETGCECCELLSDRLRRTTVDLGAVLVALGFDEPSGLAGPWPTMAAVMRRIEVLQEAKRMGFEWSEALRNCADFLSLPAGSSLSTDVPHAVAALRDQNDGQAAIILRLQSKR